MTGPRTNSVHARPRSASPGEHPPHRETSRACDSNAGAARDDGHRRARERPSRLRLGRARSGLVTSPYRLDTLPDRNWAPVPDFVLTYVFARPYLNEASAGATELLELWVLLTCTKRPSPFCGVHVPEPAVGARCACRGHRAWTRPRGLATRRAGGNIPGSC